MVDSNNAVTSESESDAVAKTPMQEIDDAYKACGFGRFHLKLIFISFLGSTAGVLVTHTTSYLLPVAECDLGMDLLEKGLLNAAPFFGMVVSSVLAGFLMDTFGRKIFLQIGFGGIFIFSIVAGSSQTYEVLLTAKFFEGMLFGTSISAHVTFLSEFCYKGIRDRVMICQASFVALSHIISPLLAWAILVQDWKVSLFEGYFVLNTWNFYLYIMSLWSFFACVLYSTLPESPKYLVTRQKYEKARGILIKIYKENTGMKAESYPYIDIWKNLEMQKTKETGPTSFTNKIVVGLHNAKPIFRMPLLCPLVMLSGTIYNIVRLWFPQLSSIVEHYNEGSQDLCVLLDKYTSNMSNMRVAGNTTHICIPIKSGDETYINSIIVGLVCLSPYFITGAIVNKVGKKVLLVICGITSVGVTLGLRWANSKVAVVALFAIDTAITQLMKGLNQAAAVELFPTEVRSLALSLVMLSGRFGTLTGNIGFPVLLDIGCVVPFYTMSGMMIGVTILTMFMPTKKH